MMIALTTPRGLPVRVPEVLSEDPSPRFAVHQSEEIRAYYRENGYIVLLGEKHCHQAAHETEIALAGVQG
jgi:hypothetical protein